MCTLSWLGAAMDRKTSYLANPDDRQMSAAIEAASLEFTHKGLHRPSPEKTTTPSARRNGLKSSSSAIIAPSDKATANPRIRTELFESLRFTSARTKKPPRQDKLRNYLLAHYFNWTTNKMSRALFRPRTAFNCRKFIFFCANSALFIYLSHLSIALNYCFPKWSI